MKVKILNEIFEINNENDLELLLINIYKYWWWEKNIIVWNLLLELVNNIENIIQTYTWFINVLKKLDERRALLFLNILSEKLPIIIENSTNLSEILARFTSYKWYKTKIIRNLRTKWLKYLIKDARDFINTVEWLFGDAENEIFKLLDENFIKKKFSSLKDIWEVYYYLASHNKIRFTDIIWFKNLKNKISNYSDLLELKWMLNSDFSLLLEYLWRDFILNLFNLEEDFYEFLLALPPSKEKILLWYLKK